MISLILLIVSVLFFVMFEAFFSGAEIAFISANRPKIFKRAKEKHPQAILAKNLLAQPETLFATTIVGTTVAIACSSSVVTYFISQSLGPDWEWLNLFVLAPFVVIFGEFIPKILGRTFSDSAVLTLSHPLRVASFVFYPLTKALEIYALTLRKMIGESAGKGFFLSREEIKAALPASLGTDVTPGERQMITRILESSRITVKDMLKPLIDVVAIEETETLQAALKLFIDSGHTRMPVYRDRIDNIVGLIHGYDCLLAKDLSVTVGSAMRPAFYMPESKPLDELLDELRTHHMGMVVNEYGGAEGVVTVEDVMEEIVGEIEDEYDVPPKLYRQIADGSYIVNARMEIDDLRENLGIPIERDEEYQTLAGFLLKRMQKIPKKWESITIDGVEYVIQSATDRTVEEVYIIRHNKPGSSMPP
ncbi:MAG: HlyC/CorC family transporter [Deltaproteobacteria bacterium]|nr:HlyC/CorC family transporter [Deltaproteobacteria bacterium]MBI3293915.1 HlyC/CorC family transporter [Deltaproteobacteria bacterium]